MLNAKKTAVVLFNLGGPDSKEAIRPFLLNFFRDPNIIRAPKPVRELLAQYIAYKRTKREAGDSYGALGNASPLLPNTKAQATALEAALNNNQTGAQFRTFIAMRYWHPMADEVVAAVKAYNPDEVILLPLYPQFSTTTTRSSLQQWQLSAKKQGLDVKTGMICCYPEEDGFIKASAALVGAELQAAKAKTDKKVRVLFSAHGLPESIIKSGDPYQWQCENTARKIAAAMGLDDAEWQICYQSRVGRLPWIKPSTEEALQKAADDKVGVVVYPHAFVSEHVETLVEIEEEYRHMAHEMGVPYFARVPTVSTHPEFIEGLKNMVLAKLGKGDMSADTGARICPNQFKDCCMTLSLKG